MTGQPNFIEDVHCIYTAKGSKAFQGFEINKILFEFFNSMINLNILE